jgi:hypothetical protein
MANGGPARRPGRPLTRPRGAGWRPRDGSNGPQNETLQSTQRNDWPEAPFIPSRYPWSGRGAHDRNRTGDLVLTKDVLYRLSYVSASSTRPKPPPGSPVGLKNRAFPSRPALPPGRSPGRMERVMGIEPTPSAWKAEVLPLNYTRPAAEPGPGCPVPHPTSPASGIAGNSLKNRYVHAHLGHRFRATVVEGVGFEPTKA